MEWFKTFVDKTLIDEKLEDMTLEEWGTRFLIQCFLGRSKVTNYIYLVNETNPTTDEKIARKLRVSLEKWLSLKESMIKKGVIDCNPAGAIGIKKWAEHQSDYYRQKKYRLKTTQKTDELQLKLQGKEWTETKEKVTGQVTGQVTHRSKNTEVRSKKTEVRSKKTEVHTIPPKPAESVGSDKPEDPEKPKELNPLQKIVVAYKLVKGFSRNDQAWDRHYFKRFCKPAQALLDIFGGNWGLAVDCIEAIGKEMSDKNLDWNLFTIEKRAMDWKLKKENKNNY